MEGSRGVGGAVRLSREVGGGVGLAGRWGRTRCNVGHAMLLQ